MTYIVLARKWRPKVFADVIGQDHVTLTLRKAVEKERLAHAYLFSGPRGCGKTSTARLLAKVINCEGRRGSEPCNECSSCVAVNEGTHLDMIEIDGASNRGIDEIRDLREKIGYASAGGRSKIYIIDEVHMLTPQAFNALLKTLEEPPPHVYLVFATTEPHKVPATILSRCQRFNFKRLELPELSGQLEMICREEKVDYDEEALVMISRRADGSMRDAESLLDQCISALDKKVDIETVRRVLGLVDSQVVTGLLDYVSRRDRKGVLEVIDRVVSSGLDLEELFLAYIEGLRNLLVLKVGEEDSADWLDLTSAEIESLSKIGGAFSTEDLLYLFSGAARSFREFKGASQPRYHLEAALTEAASWDSAVDISDLIRRIEGSGSVGGGPEGVRKKREGEGPGNSARAGGAGRRESRAASAGGRSGNAGDVNDRDDSVPAEEGAFARIDPCAAVEPSHDDPSLGRLGGKEQWERFLAQVREAKLTLGIWLMSARVVGVEDDRIRLSFSPQNRFACEMIREEKNRQYVESHLERFYGRKFFVEAGESVKNPPDGRSAPAKAPARKTDIKDDAEIDRLVSEAPMVKRLIEEFDGELFRNKDDRRTGE